MMTLTIEQVMADAKKLVERLSEHDGAADVLITQSETLNKRIDAMKQYQEDLVEMNEAARHRPRSALVLGIQQENRQIRELQQENKELRTALEEHQSALELIMSKYREQVLKLILANKVDKSSLNVQQNNSKELQNMTEKICELALVMSHAIDIDDEAVAKETEVITQLQVENKGLREVLGISHHFNKRRQRRSQAGSDAEVTSHAGSETEILPQLLSGSDTEVTAQSLAGSDTEVTSQSHVGSDTEIVSQSLAGSDVDITPQSHTGSDAEIASQSLAGSDGETTPQSQAASDAEAMSQSLAVSDADITPQSHAASESETTSQSHAASDAETTPQQCTSDISEKDTTEEDVSANVEETNTAETTADIPGEVQSSPETPKPEDDNANDTVTSEAEVSDPTDVAQEEIHVEIQEEKKDEEKETPKDDDDGGDLGDDEERSAL